MTVCVCVRERERDIESCFAGTSLKDTQDSEPLLLSPREPWRSWSISRDFPCQPRAVNPSHSSSQLRAEHSRHPNPPVNAGPV